MKKKRLSSNTLGEVVGLKLARKIALKLFTPQGGRGSRFKHVSRISLKGGSIMDGTEYDICGWGFNEAIEEIHKVIINANTSVRGGTPYPASTGSAGGEK